ncbi:MAG: NAD-dependent epimerase/dehydratase family protein [Nitrososphaerales archaeon]
MRILLTGAAGFYGSHLTNLLLSLDDETEIIGIDNLRRQEDFPVDPFNVIEDKEAFAKRFVLQKVDFRSLDFRQIDSLNVDFVIHLAALASIPESMVIPKEYFEINELGTFNLVQELLKSKTQPFLIFASSPEVYGDPIYTPLNLDHPSRPRSFYAVTKLAGERHCMVMSEWYGYPVCIIRNFNTYGENQSNTYRGYPAVVPEFISKALLNQPIIIHGEGNQTRDLLYVRDAVSAYLKVVERSGRSKGEIFDIGTGIQTSILALAESIIELTGSSSKIFHTNGRPADLAKLEADSTRVREVLGWAPSYSLRAGLSRTIPWYRSVLGKLQSVHPVT